MNRTDASLSIHQPVSTSRPHSITISVATDEQRQTIYRMRHEVYARELGQHAANDAALLSDSLDMRNVYLVATIQGQVAGFVSLTPPGERYSIDKYMSRESLPFPADDWLYEVRLLTVARQYRGRELATLLMYAAFRWVESHGGRRVAAIGRREVVEMYLRCGLAPLGVTISCGAVTYDLLAATTMAVRERINTLGGVVDRLETSVDWRLGFPFRKPACCFHGGAFFDAIGPRLDSLERSRSIINADVLDAWFPPAPGVLQSLQDFLPWLLRTSPPTACEGLIQAIADARGVHAENILPGAGSSDLIFRALRTWLSPGSHALILDPTYGEYPHVLENVIGCTTDRLALSRSRNFTVDFEQLQAAMADNYDLIVIVNPNSPTGQHIGRADVEKLLRDAPHGTRIWVDETYTDYVGPDESLETFAAKSENVVVCKSMSKVYALSGARVAYLCASPHQLEELRAYTPPWVVSLPAQLAAIRALAETRYYRDRYAQTRALREALSAELSNLGLTCLPGVANFILCELPVEGPSAAEVVKRCRAHGLFLRDASTMGSRLGSHMLRIAVKDAETNRRMLQVLRDIHG